jgi:hypothetical protein
VEAPEPLRLARQEEAEAEDEDLPFWISVAPRSGFTRLHRKDGCHVRRADCRQWHWVAEIKEGVADEACRLCWPEGGAADEKAGSSATSDSEESDSSSGASAARPDVDDDSFVVLGAVNPERPQRDS